MYDERFARQYRYEPPPEFPLASPYSGIVHHLSGPNIYAHTQTFLPKNYGRRIVPHKSPTTVTFITHGSLPPLYSHICWTPWSVFQDGVMKTILSRSRALTWLTSISSRIGEHTKCMYTVTPNKIHLDRRPATASLLQATGKIWQNCALVSIAYLSAISGTF